MKGVVKLKLASLWWVFFFWETHSTSCSTPVVWHWAQRWQVKKNLKWKLMWKETWSVEHFTTSPLSPPLLWKKIFCVNILSILSLNLSLSFYLDSHFLGELRSQTRLGRSKNDFFPLNSLNLSNLFYCFISQSFGTTWALCTIWLGLLGWLLRCDL